MTMTTTGIQTIIYPTSDLDTAKALFAALGATPIMDEPYYVGYKVEGQDIGLDPNGHKKGMNGPTAYWHVSDIKAALAGLVEAGAALLSDAQDVGGGRLIAQVKDTDGNMIGLLQDPS
jgi:predicted enzyme related to lactoylglutathione lyase